MEEISIKPYKSGYLDVGQGHKLYYESCGNPQGKLILYVHGGPGAGFSESAKRWFDPKLWNIILFDQRGSGRSTPFASLENNTTDDLVDDMNKLLDFLKIKSVTLFGGSWGSTLSLVYAIRNRNRVNGMVLRGIFLPSKEDNRYYLGGAVENFYPEVWQRFISPVPENKRKKALQYYIDKMQHGTPEEKKLFTYEWSYYEMSLIHLKRNPKKIENDMKDANYLSLSPIEAHYLMHNCFLPENYILDHANELSGMPTFLIHGRYDMICRPLSAYTLHKAITGSQLFFTTAGHASGEPQTRRKLLWAVKKMYEMV